MNEVSNSCFQQVSGLGHDRNLGIQFFIIDQFKNKVSNRKCFYQMGNK